MKKHGNSSHENEKQQDSFLWCKHHSVANDFHQSINVWSGAAEKSSDGISAFSKAEKLLMLMQYKEPFKFMTSNSCSVTPKDNSNLMLQDIKEFTGQQLRASPPHWSSSVLSGPNQPIFCQAGPELQCSCVSFPRTRLSLKPAAGGRKSKKELQGCREKGAENPAGSGTSQASWNGTSLKAAVVVGKGTAVADSYAKLLKDCLPCLSTAPHNGLGMPEIISFPAFHIAELKPSLVSKARTADERPVH
ncbi:hypothetical protein Anapl_00300 [Anas platyrhynchos]|uniref:Uncharacterized protein n=1 Tax=Anas platyrhynchos TaxID=8839 RepID=R0LQT3_ANAPL|nr:hypothetical protein Anapl_00300 [Anas platyrhynchos]